MHYEITSDVEEWRAWAYRAEIDPYIIGFITLQGDMLFQFKPDLNELAWASPRSWHFASRLQNLRNEDMDLYNKSLQATVGKAAAQQFMAFLKYKNTMPNPRDILDGKEYEVPEQLDGKFVLMSALIDELFRTKLPVFDDAVKNFMAYVSTYDESIYSDHGVVIIKELLTAARAKPLPESETNKTTASKSVLKRDKAKTTGTFVSKIITNTAYKDWQKRNGNKLK